jgi:hypothetical protein
MPRRCRGAVLARTLAHLRVADGPAAPPAEAAPAAKITARAAHFTLPEDDPDPAAPRMGLSAKEVAFFKRTGWLVKRGLIPRADLAPFVVRPASRALSESLSLHVAPPRR